MTRPTQILKRPLLQHGHIACYREASTRLPRGRPFPVTATPLPDRLPHAPAVAAAPPTEGPRRVRLPSWAGSLGVALYAVVAWVYLLSFPHGLPLPFLDPSWSAVAALASAEHWAFGRRIMLNYGPWSHLGSGFFYSPLFMATYWFQIVSKAVLVALLCRVSRPLPGVGRALFLAANLLTGLVEWETIHLLAIVYAGWLLSEDRTRTGRVIGGAGVVLAAAAALMKTFYFVFGLGVFGCVLARHVLRGRGRWPGWREGLAAPTGFLLCCAVDWRLAGQHFSDLPAYLHGAAELMGAHSRAMGLDAEPGVFCLSLVMLLWTGAVGFIRLGRTGHGPRAASVPLAAVFVGGLFMAWKQGFSRADEFHVSAYVWFIAVSISAWPLFFERRAFDPKWYYSSLGGVWLLAALTIVMARPQEQTYLADELPSRPWKNLQVLFHPAATRAWLDARVARMRETCALPQTKATVSRARIDCFGTMQDLLLLNGMNYAPVPTLQGFLAFTPYLVELDRRCYDPGRAPEFVLFQGGSIDTRWPSLDGAVQLRELLTNYQPVLTEATLLLLRRKPAAECVPPRPVLQQHGELALDTRLDLPADGADWCELEVHRTFLGQLINFFYHEPVLNIETVSATGQRNRWTLPPIMAQGGFLLRQGPRTTDDMIQLLAGKPVRDPMVSMRLGGDGLLPWAIQGHVAYRFYHLDPPTPVVN